MEIPWRNKLEPDRPCGYQQNMEEFTKETFRSDSVPIGKIEAFNETSDNWNAYVDWVEQYFIANEIKEDKQVAVMLSLMGNKTYGL